MTDLVARGIACPASRQGEIPLDVSVDFDSCAVRLRQVGNHNACELENETIGAKGQTICWRILIQNEIVVEIRKALNLFQLKSSWPSVPGSAAVQILAETWKASA